MDTVFFSGACTALVTPFLNGKINLDMLKLLLDRQLEAGIGTIVVCGTTGESPTLSDEEKLLIVRTAKEHTGKGCTILAGTGSNDTRHTITLSKQAEDAGADGLLVVSPYYNKATADGLVTHYSAVASAVSIPIVLYNVPGRTGVDIPVTVYEVLSAIPNIAGVKEATTDITKITKILHACPRSFAVWSGNDDRIVPVMSLGGAGVISVLSNVVPMETQAMTLAAQAGDFDTAAALQIHLQPLVEQLFSVVNPIPVKAAMKMIGYDCGECRLPLTPLTHQEYAKLKDVLKQTV